MTNEIDPTVNQAIAGVWQSHQGLATDQVISVLHEAVKAVGGKLDEDEYTRIGTAIADGTYTP
ncbi:hypothetical protein [Glaciihabitans sp. dw_435]|uniref:hypothetical protein n=1 Tax=Glaciihabitans sp. dw_435 TaxID=2720081 RepID=UPI001BD4576D|nr:hypothetical protein [Glaciihabitans sp. dw_435]